MRLMLGVDEAAPQLHVEECDLFDRRKPAVVVTIVVMIMVVGVMDMVDILMVPAVATVAAVAIGLKPVVDDLREPIRT